MDIAHLNTKVRLYDTLVNSVSLYGSQVWGVYYLRIDTKEHVMASPAQSLFIFFLRYITGCNSKTCKMSLLKEFHIAPLQIRIACTCAKFWNDAWKNSNITADILRADIRLMYKGNDKCWSALFLKAMHDLGLLRSYSWLAIRSGTANCDLESYLFDPAAIKVALENIYSKLWKDNEQTWTSNSVISIGAAYLKYKSWFYDKDVETHKHHKAFISLKKLKILVKFRLGGSALRINDHSIPRNNRVCPCCNNGNIEDEKHFIFNCQSFNNFRHCHAYMCLWTDHHDIKAFCNQDNQILLANLLHDMFIARNRLLNNNLLNSGA